MLTDTASIVGFRVVEPPASGKGRDKMLSRTFTVRAAAYVYLELARRAGHQRATIQTVYAPTER